MDDEKTHAAGFRKGRIPLEKAIKVARKEEQELWPIAEAVLVVGSVRRQKSVVGDVDLLVLPKDVGRAIRHLKSLGYYGDDRILRRKVSGVGVEVYLAHDPSEMGALQIYTTGDRAFNDRLREIAREEGLRLTPYGLFRANGKVMVQSPDERDFFDALGVPWGPPEDRSWGHA